ncbi:hypothetical protein D515_00949 [Grimontia indica]|uniref:Uncharacterized protein n=1 Tax=Grimontia indica TaxID=1056512 RepID=R1IGF7_9GAMM|nr:hypothetical protein [Grimontia indica]EOD79816.1 hypothetical protein D515_00949 [Grimontia indica]
MKSAKEFAAWLMERFESHSNVWLTRNDITELTSRQSVRSEFIHDVHCELMNYGRALIADIKNNRYYMVSLSDTYWKDVGDIYAEQTNKAEQANKTLNSANTVERFPGDAQNSRVRPLRK